MNHFALFIKLTNRNTPVNLLAVIEKWFAISVTYVKWGDRMSNFFNLMSGVRQGGVLSPSLFVFMCMVLLRKLFSVISAVICNLFAQVFFYMAMISS